MLETEKKLIKELKDLGYKYKDAQDIFKQKEIAPSVVNAVLKWLPNIYKEHLGTGDTLVRSLIGASKPFNAEELIKLFEESDYNFSVKSGIAHTLSIAKTNDISKWIKDQLLTKEAALERALLVYGLLNKAGFTNDDEIKEFVKRIFDKYPFQAIDVFKKIGTEDDVDFLLERLHDLDKKYKPEIKKVIAVLVKRKKTT